MYLTIDNVSVTFHFAKILEYFDYMVCVFLP